MLVRDAQLGDTAAFEELVRHYDRPVLRLVLHLTGSAEDAQDIYQEAFLRAYQNLPHFGFECSFYTWLYRIVASLCLEYLHKSTHCCQKVAPVCSGSAELDPLAAVPSRSTDTSPKRSFAGHALQERLAQALGRLSPRERVVFEMRHYHGLRLRTVADILQTTEDTIRNTLLRAAHKLQLDLAEVR